MYPLFLLQLRDFLRFVVNSAGEDYNPAATIFIGNKIDSVDVRDLQAVKNTTAYKLKQCYPGLKDSNIFFMSVNQVCFSYCGQITTINYYKLQSLSQDMCANSNKIVWSKKIPVCMKNIHILLEKKTQAKLNLLLA